MRDETVEYVDSSNIDEYMFEITGKSHRNFFWKTWMRLRWKIRDWKYKRLTKRIRYFFHKDLQELRSEYLKNGSTVSVRYTDRFGDLYTQRFRIKHQYSGFTLTELKGSIPRLVQGTKGPRTLKAGYLVSSRYYCLGLRRLKVWRIRYAASL